jgi:uncharacterized protein YbcI
MVPHQEDRPEPGDPGPDEEIVELSWQVVADEISRDILAIHRDSYGRGAESITAYLVEDMVIVLLDGLELMPNEEFLIANGEMHIVAAIRSQYQQAIEATFRAAVERAMGRTVIGFTSHTQLEEPRFAIEIFRLLPRQHR